MNAGCFKCDKAQWDADGCTCEITGLLVGDAARGCEYRKDTLEEQLKDLKEEYANLNKISCGFYKELKEALELIREYKAENIAQKKMIAEYKRLLKAAVEDVNFSSICLNRDACKACAKRYNISCEKKFKWRYADEALALIGDEPNGI
jgi:hypothetical protein